MSGDRERVVAFAILFATADVPLLVLEALPRSSWALAVGPLLALVSWVGAGTYLVAAARANSLETRGWVDAPWAVATLGLAVGFVALNPLVPGRPVSPWTPMAAIGATILLGLFWAVYGRGGGAMVGPAPFRYGLRSLSLEDRVIVGAFLLSVPAGIGLLAVDPTLPEGLFLLLVGGVPMGSYLVSMWLMGRRRARGWSRMARDLGWDEPERPGAPLEGRSRGRRVGMGTIEERARWLSFWTTDVHVELEPAPAMELHIRPEGRLGRLQRALGARDAQVGDDRYDDRFLVGTDDPDAAAELFRVLGERLVEARGEVKAVLLEEGKLVVAQPGFVTDPARIRRVLDLAGRAADVLERAAREAEEGDESIW